MVLLNNQAGFLLASLALVSPLAQRQSSISQVNLNFPKNLLYYPPKAHSGLRCSFVVFLSGEPRKHF